MIARAGIARAMVATTANPLSGLAHVWDHPFLRSALIAGTCIALASGLIGYVVVLRGQVFTGDALSHVAFTGALAALAFGADLRVGLYGACVAFALLLALLGRRASADDSVIGSVFAWILGLGALFLSIFTTGQSGSSGAGGDAGVNVLFGSILGLSPAQTVEDSMVALAVAAGVVVMGRPLVFASLDPDVAGARGVPVRVVGYAFFVLLGLTAGVATQAVGALLLLGLLAAPAGASQLFTSRPFPGLWLSGGIAVVSMWGGLLIAYLAPRVPPSFGILAVATAAYALAGAVTAVRGRRQTRRSGALDRAERAALSGGGRLHGSATP